jgi:hypothetical protein
LFSQRNAHVDDVRASIFARSFPPPDSRVAERCPGRLTVNPEVTI